MPRTTNIKKAAFIAVGDIHLRETAPVCRTDDFVSEQWRKFNFLLDLSMNHNCPIYSPGDFFDKWNCSAKLLWKTLADLECHDQMIFIVPGNHDIPRHSMELFNHSGLAVVDFFPLVDVLYWASEGLFMNKIKLYPVPYGSKFPKIHPAPGEMLTVVLAHTMVWDKEPPYPGCDDMPAIKLLNTFEGADFVIAGDNHQGFVAKNKRGQVLINCGSMMRTNTRQVDHKPFAVVVFYDGTYKLVDIPIADNVITREHIDVKKEKDKAIEVFVKSIEEMGDISNSFIINARKIAKANKATKAQVERLEVLFQEVQ